MYSNNVWQTQIEQVGPARPMRSGSALAARHPKAARQSDNVGIWCLSGRGYLARFRNRYGGFNGILRKATFRQTTPSRTKG